MLNRILRQKTIKGKLTVAIMATTLSVLLLGAGTFIFSEVHSYRQNTINTLTSIAGVIGTNLKEPVQLKRKSLIAKTLQSVKNEPEIVVAYVFAADSTPLAHYLNNSHLGHEPLEALAIDRQVIQNVIKENKQRYLSGKNHLTYLAPIISQETVIGVIALKASLAGLYALIYQFILATLLFFVLLTALAYLIASRLQEPISKPIQRLSQVMTEVSEKGNFGVRAEPAPGDEIGGLISGFNHMLEQIQLRDQQLEEYRLNLEQLVQQRTQELEQANSDLKQAVREIETAKMSAEKASQAKSQFLAKMSHEIRTPMIGILGMAEQLSEASLPEDESRLALTVCNSSETLLSILDDVLDFSRIEAEKVSLEQIPFDLKELCEEVISIYAEKAKEKGIRLCYHAGENFKGKFIGDPVRVKQILLNLISNAVKFTHEGEVVVTTNITGDSSNKHKTIWLGVTDTGIGIDKQAQKIIFESFSQADNTMTRKYGGSGLGLSIVRQLTHLMGGRCGLQSTPGKGSTFWVVIDLIIAEKENPEALKLAQKTDTTNTVVECFFNDRNILLVEDNETTQQLLSLIFNKTGCTFDIKDNGIHAIEALDKTDYDLILMDCEMPDMDGFETTRLLRKKGYNKPIVALTAHANEMGISKCFEAGMDDFLNKPFRKKQLLEMVTKWLPEQVDAANE